MLVFPTSCLKFEEAPAIVWQASKTQASSAPTQFVFILKLGNACDSLYQFRLVQHNEANSAVRHCQEVFQDQILTPLSKLNPIGKAPAYVLPTPQQAPARQPIGPLGNQLPRNVPRQIQRRGVMDFVAGSLVTNLVETVLDRWWPNPAISTLEEKEKLLDAKLELLNNRTTFSALAQKALLEGQTILRELVQNNVAAIQTMSSAYPQLAIVASDLVARSHLVGSYIEQLAISFKMANLDLPLLYLLLKQEVILDINPNTIVANSLLFSSPSSGLLRIEFVARRKAQDIAISRVNAFHVWVDLLSDRPRLMEYVGPKYVIRNSKNNCVKGIQDPQDDTISVKCEVPNFEDQRLSRWRELAQHDKVEDHATHTQVIEAWPSIYVSCPSERITIGSENGQCPPFHFR